MKHQKKEQHLWLALAGIGTLAALAIWGLSGCGGLPTTRRVEVRPAWAQPMGAQPIDILSTDNRRLLRVSADGRIWEWDSSAEDIISMLIEDLARQQAMFAQYKKETEEKLHPKKEDAKKPLDEKKSK